MTAVLISGVALIAAGMFLLGAYCHRAVENALRWLLVKLMPADGAHRVPASDVEQSFSRPSREPATIPSVLLASESYVPVPLALPWVPQERRQTEDHPPWTGSQVAITPEIEAVYAPETGDEDESELDRRRYIRARLDECGPLPTTEQLREILGTLRQADVPAPASSFPCCRHCTPPCEPHHVACMDCHPAFGTDRCEADVLAAEDGAQMARQP